MLTGTKHERVRARSREDSTQRYVLPHAQQRTTYSHPVTKMSAAIGASCSWFAGVKVSNGQAGVARKPSGRVALVVEARRTKASTPSGGGLKVAKFGSTVGPDLYPEFGTYPGGGESPVIPFNDEKNAEREIIHGRWAMLGVTGAWAAENGTGIPWFTAGTLCTPDDCTAVADKFPGAIAPLAPEGSGYPSFWAGAYTGSLFSST